LACRVPDLQLDTLVINGNCFGSKLHANRDIMGGPGLILDELKDDARFADS
jgi:hypothetical protein